jgi:hypothetical protein
MLEPMGIIPPAEAEARSYTIGLCFRLVGSKGARRHQPAPLQSERIPSVLFKGRWYYALNNQPATAALFEQKWLRQARGGSVDRIAPFKTMKI